MENFLHAGLERWIDLGVFDVVSVSSRSRGELRFGFKQFKNELGAFTLGGARRLFTVVCGTIMLISEDTLMMT